MSLRRFDGWEPRETHTYLDRDGNPCAMAEAWSTLVEREPEWDDRSRNYAEAFDEHDADCCPGCGTHQSILDDPDNNVFTFEERVCRVCAAQDVFGRVITDSHEKAAKRLGENPPPRMKRPDDGHHIYIRRATPEELSARPISRESTAGPQPHPQ